MLELGGLGACPLPRKFLKIDAKILQFRHITLLQKLGIALQHVLMERF